MSAIELYNAPQSTCSQKVRLTLAEKGLAFKEYRLKLFAGDQLRPEYLALNPNGVVPTVVHDGTPIIDSSVIMEYLDEVFPWPRLSPSDPKKRAEMRAWLRFFEEVPTVAVRYPSYNAAFARHFSEMSEAEFRALAASKPVRDVFLAEMDKDTGFSEARIRQSEQSIRKTAMRMQGVLRHSHYLVGDSLTLADICVLPLLVRMSDLGNQRLWSDLAGVSHWLERMTRRQSYATAFYPGSLLSEQYEHIAALHQARDGSPAEAAPARNG
jgi:glutathione S-transferase